MVWRDFISPTNWHYNFCLAIAFALPLHKKYVPLIIVAYAVYAIIYAIRKRYLNKSFDIRLWIFPAALYLLMLSSFGITLDKGVALKELEYKASMIVFPLLSLITPSFTREEVRKMIRAFVGGCLLFAVIAIGYGLYRAWLFDSREYLTYSYLGIYFHPTYMAMYQSLALFWMVSQGVKRSYIAHRFYLHLGAVGLIILFIVMLASKAGLLSAAAAMVWEMRVVYSRKWNIRRGWIWTGTAVALLIILTISLPLTSQRIDRAATDVGMTVQPDEPAEDALPVSEGSKSSTALRKVTWLAAWEVIRQNPVGAGIGNSSAFMDRQYEQMGEPFAREKHLNTHNQFLQHGVESGIPGLVVFLVFIVVAGFRAVRSGSIFYQAFIGLAVLNFLFESVLEVQAGVVFFYFFLAVLNNGILNKDSGV